MVAAAEAEDAITELLSGILGQASAYHDFETGQTTVSAFIVDQGAFRQGKLRILEGLRLIQECGLTPVRPRLTFRKVRHEDWAESWKRHFKPLEIGRRLLIKPSWSRRRAKAGQAVMILDPGLSFGTGHHPTTAFCLSELARCASKKTGSGFLDAGTGSGILAIAAAKLGFSPVDAFDYDLDALRVARANGQRNRVAAKIRFFRRDATKLPIDRKYPVICANLSTDVLKQAIGRLARCLESGGLLVLAGILKGEFASIQGAAAKAGLRLVRRRNRERMEFRSVCDIPVKFL